MNRGIKFVYPYGSTITVQSPAIPILSSGPISFPISRPIGAAYESQVCYFHYYYYFCFINYLYLLDGGIY